MVADRAAPAAAALVILAAAGPIWNPQTGLAGSSAPLVILLDDGWSAAASWDIRIKAADELIANADNDRRGVALVPLSEPARDITLMPPAPPAWRCASSRQSLIRSSGSKPCPRSSVS